MLANNNRKVITRMAKRSLVSNKRKNLMMVIAVLLASFMLFSVLTVGGTFFKMQRQQDIRLSGADFDAYIYGGFTEEQKRVCDKNTKIETVCVEGMAGWAEKSELDDTLHTIFIWADDTRWNKMMAPAVKQVKGRYPQKDDEVMATKKALEDCGLEHLNIGDSFKLTYTDNLGSHTKRFTLSGIRDGYGDQEVFYVSQSFFQQSGFKFTDSGRSFLYLKFKSFLVTGKTQKELESSLNLSKKQHLIFTSDAAWSMQLLAGMAGLILITCLSAYLLIYNILYLSISGNIRYYGLLQTVGMSGRQIRRLIKKQMLFVGAAGIGSGLILGAAASFVIIPAVVKTLGIRQTQISVFFHPAILLAVIFLAAVTIYLGSRKPVRIATEISPVEAMGYRSQAGAKRSHKTGRGRLIRRLAQEQLTRDKKKTLVVVLSLTATLSVFLCLATLIASQGPRTIVSGYMDTDMVIKNDTMWKEDQSQWKQLFDRDFFSRLSEEEEIREFHPMFTARIVVPWKQGFVDSWMEKMYEMWMNETYDEVKEDYKKHPEKYYSNMIGIDQGEFEYLNSTLKTPVNKKDFLAGKACILYGSDLEFDEKTLKKQELTCALKERPDKPYSLEIAGATDDTYYALPGVTPTIIVSEAFMKTIIEEPYILKLAVHYQEEYDETAESEVMAAMEASPYAKDFSYDSKLEEMKATEKAQNNMMGIGIGITVLLALIGIMNYINTVSGNIQNRKVELAIMESVGMTDRQIRKMLVAEGLLYAAVSLLLTGTIGLGVTYLIYQSMNYMDIAFAVPALPVLAMVLVVTAICVIVPLLAYRLLVGKKAVVERIRGVE
ncbi:ABC transporter permease [Anaerovorax odorimutans]|uniref:ABC transporter permease n=1 Tax=Anaerovorax odorimutans TaxID=109327 RepID=A0ABT1RMK4_9FIRM|nr:ABC transporter permease [Anaerovorax odorimutans]MCQ4636402.1 ABC transporter permease [Anaerovorax odorimutans]